MKKWLFILISMLCLLSFVACGGESGSDRKSDKEVSSQDKSKDDEDEDENEDKDEDEAKKDEAEVDSEKEEVKQDASEDEEDDDDESVLPGLFDDEEDELKVFEFEEIVIDNEYCTVKITGAEKEEYSSGYEIFMYLENKSADVNYTFEVDDVTIDGVAFDSYFSEDLRAGKKVKTSVDVYQLYADVTGMIEMTDIKMLISVYEEDADWDAEPIYSELVHAYPAGKEKAKLALRKDEPTDTVLYDNENYKVVATGIGHSEYSGTEVYFYIENKTAGESAVRYVYYIDEITVNGLLVDGYFENELDAGSVAFYALSISDDELKPAGIDKITDLGLIFEITEESRWDNEPFTSDEFHVYPYGVEKAEKYERTVNDTDVVLYDNEFFTVIATSLYPREYWGQTLDVYIANKTNNKLAINLDESYVNGYSMTGSYWSDYIPAGKAKFSQLYWDFDELSDNEIDVIEEIEIVIDAYNSDDWYADYYADGEVAVYRP